MAKHVHESTNTLALSNGELHILLGVDHECAHEDELNPCCHGGHGLRAATPTVQNASTRLVARMGATLARGRYRDPWSGLPDTDRAWRAF